MTKSTTGNSMTPMPFITVSFLALIFGTCQGLAQQSVDVWIGTGRSALSKGIYQCVLNTKTGTLSNPSLAAEISGPGFLAMHPDRSKLYAVGSLGGKASVVAYQISGHGNDASLKLLNSIEIGDGGATHLCVDKRGGTILTAQYGGGSVAVFTLNEDGALEKKTQLIEHEGGSGVVPGRQDSPHPHWVGFSPDNRFAFVPDLGLDRVAIYRFDGANSRITPHGHAKLLPGAGPRHMKFISSGNWAYVLNELDLSVSVFDYSKDVGAMTAKQTIPTVPKEDLQGERFKSASEIRLHPSGRFVYAANRGHDTITAFRVNPDTGELSVIEREFIRGATPRNFNLDPSGNWLLAAGQNSHTLASFSVDQSTGELTYNQSVVFAPSAICVLFGPE